MRHLRKMINDDQTNVLTRESDSHDKLSIEILVKYLIGKGNGWICKWSMCILAFAWDYILHKWTYNIQPWEKLDLLGKCGTWKYSLEHIKTYHTIKDDFVTTNCHNLIISIWEDTKLTWYVKRCIGIMSLMSKWI